MTKKAARRVVAPRCVQCGKRPVKIPTGGERFCTRRCAADWALERSGWDDTWCGKRHDDSAQSSLSGPHGWWSGKDYERCPECEDEQETA